MGEVNMNTPKNRGIVLKKAELLLNSQSF